MWMWQMRIEQRPEGAGRGTPFAPPGAGGAVSLGSPRSRAAAARERAEIDGYACGAAKRSGAERDTERAALVPGWSTLQRRIPGKPDCWVVSVGCAVIGSST
jgi:hypothetical protein